VAVHSVTRLLRCPAWLPTYYRTPCGTLRASRQAIADSVLLPGTVALVVLLAATQ
jgi:hypothetical protein